MGCKPSKLDGANSNAKAVMSVGQTERQLSKMQRAAMSLGGTDAATATSTTGEKSAELQKESSDGKPKLDHQGYLLPEEVAKRTFSSITNQEVTLGTRQNVTHVQFATWTQRGYYPEDPHKMNQDKFGTHLNFAGVKKDAMFAVYDGHGAEGHSCAQFAKEKLPRCITKHVRKVRCQKYQAKLKEEHSLGKKKAFNPDNWPMLNPQEYEQCCIKAFLEVNQAMHDDPKIPDKLSGTTATTVCFHGDLVSVGNVGDSRVVLGHRVKGNASDKGNISMLTPMHYHDNNTYGVDSGEEEKSSVDDEIEHASIQSSVHEQQGQWRQRSAPPGTSVLAIPLSRDQTPYRKDERERVKRLGASIMSIDQMQGKVEVHDNWGDMVLGETIDVEGDSPRVWVDGKDYPGCAFTRSLGDNISEDIGVTGEPEMLTTQLTLNDEYIVIASDGIFEFLTNQAVIEMCASSESPLEACEKIVKQAYQQWLVYESRTDDITIIVCFLQNLRAPPTDGMIGTTEELIGVPLSVYGNDSSHISVSPVKDESYPSRIQKKDDKYEENPRQAPAVFLEAAPAPPMAFADFDTDTVEVKVEHLMKEANLNGKGSSNGAIVSGYSSKDDSVSSDSPENDDPRNTIRL